MFASELEFYLYKQSYAQAHEQDYRDLTPDDPLHPRLPHPRDDDGRERARPDPARDAGRRDPGRVLQGRGVVRPARGQHRATRTRSPPPTGTRSTRTASRRSRSCNGVSATFMAKPSEKDIGSSCHIHSSLSTRAARARSSTATRRPTSSATTSAACARGSASSRCSSRRRSTRTSATPPRAGRRPRSPGDATTAPAGFRIVGHGQSRRVECRIPGADVNPYLGVRGAARRRSRRDREQDTDPGPELKGNAYAEAEAEPFPSTLREAVDLWEGSEFARATFGEQVWRHYLNYGRTEQRLFDEVVTDYERRRMFERG